MSENLNVRHFRNGDPIPFASNSDEWIEKNDGPVCAYYEYKTENGKKYGLLYNWHAVNDPRGLAPAGWHIPSTSEWEKLIKKAGGKEKAGNHLKSKTGWNRSSNVTNETGFSALPGGWCEGHSPFREIGEKAYWWTSTPTSRTNGGYVRLTMYDGSVFFYSHEATAGKSVRCVKD